MSDSILDKLFPAVPPGTRRERGHGSVHGIAIHDELRDKQGKRSIAGVSTRWAAIYTLELRGLTHRQIAEALNMAENSISKIVTDERYIEYRNQHLSALDQEFVAMKPLAFAALKGGLTSSDENTALRASEQWFKGANYGGFSKHERPSTALTAEDVARELLRGGPLVQVNTQVNVTPSAQDE